MKVLDRILGAQQDAISMSMLYTRANPRKLSPEYGAAVVMAQVLNPPKKPSMQQNEQDRKPVSELEQQDPERFDGMS